MKNTNLTICDATIHPGEVANLALPLPELYSCTSFYMPIKIIHGKQAGPCLLVFAAVNGDELNGIEIINRLLADEKLSEISGTLIAVPVLNVSAMMNYPNALPSNEQLETCFPGSEHGSYGERIAYVFTQEILRKADYCIELRTGSLNHAILPQVYCNLDNKENRRLAKQFLTPVVTNVQVEDNSLRQTTEDLNVPLLVYQAGEAMRFDESAINLGFKGILNVMSDLQMLDMHETETIDGFKPTISQDEDWIRAARSGMLHPLVELGAMIKKGEVIGKISDPFSADIAEPVKALNDGVVVGINNQPLIYEGQTIFKVASFIDNDKAETIIENWGEHQSDTGGS